MSLVKLGSCVFRSVKSSASFWPSATPICHQAHHLHTSGLFHNLNLQSLCLLWHQQIPHTRQAPSQQTARDQLINLHNVRGVFGVRAKPKNLQIHTHDKYKATNSQPSYDWMKGRYILDRNGIIWHKQANSTHKKHNKSSSQQTRLKRWKPLYKTYATKFKKLGFNLRYWSDPDPQDVPGFHKEEGYMPSKRWNADADLREDVGDPALRPH